MKRCYQITLQGESHQVELVARSANSITFIVAGKEHTVHIAVLPESQLANVPLAASSLIPTSHSTPTLVAQAGSIAAPMPGIVTKLLVSPGAQVKPGDPLLVIEAMKMENNIVATSAGSVDSISVSVGDEVKKGQVLVSVK